MLLPRLLGQVEAGSYVEPTKITLSEFAYSWLMNAKPNLAPSTWAQYDLMLRRHICPRIGNAKVTELHPIAVQDMLTALHDTLAPKSVHHAFTVLRRLLNQAVRYGLLRESPMKKVDAPKVPKREMATWTPEQAAQFLESVRGDRLYAVYYLALATGMRRGEILGLKWSDIDFGRMRINVQRAWVKKDGVHELREPKGGWQRAVAMSSATAEVLVAHKAWQDIEGAPNPLGMVFVSKKGNPVHTSSLNKQQKLRVKAASLPRIRFHDMRHTHVTFLFDSGYSHKVVQERIGHRHASTTLDIYGHAGADIQREAAATTDNLLKPRSK